ncbi:hypothetical protein TMatcc_007511 [Talaromyces marneffei ATCC 18224]
MGMIQPISKPRSPHSAIDALIEARLVLCLCISVSIKPTGVVLLNIHCIALRRVLLVLISSE